MKIAVPVTNENQIESHIGNCESYKIFTISDKKEIAGITSIKSPGGCGCNTDIAANLASDGVTVVIAAGIGGGSTKAFNRSGIDVVRGCSGDATEVVELYLSGSVEDKGSSCHKHQPQSNNDEKHTTHRVPEIVGIHESGHQCACGSGKGNSCSNN